MKLHAIYASVLISLLTGCSSAPSKAPLISESLITNITAQGLKQFTYQVTMAMEGQPGGRPGGNGGGGGFAGPGMGGGPGGGRGMGGEPQSGMQDMRHKMQKNTAQAMFERLEEKLATTGFCDNGWFVIRQDFKAGAGEILGECRASSGS